MSTDDRDDAARPTDAPPVVPTIVPAFDVAEFARDSSFRRVPTLLSDTVLEVVENVSWSKAQLDLVEMEVIGYIDGVLPVTMLESMVTLSRDELHAMLVTLLARGFVRIGERTFDVTPPNSGIYHRTLPEASAKKKGT